MSLRCARIHWTIASVPGSDMFKTIAAGERPACSESVRVLSQYG